MTTDPGVSSWSRVKPSLRRRHSDVDLGVGIGGAATREVGQAPPGLMSGFGSITVGCAHVATDDRPRFHSSLGLPASALLKDLQLLQFSSRLLEIIPRIPL